MRAAVRFTWDSNIWFMCVTRRYDSSKTTWSKMKYKTFQSQCGLRNNEEKGRRKQGKGDTRVGNVKFLFLSGWTWFFFGFSYHRDMMRLVLAWPFLHHFAQIGSVIREPLFISHDIFWSLQDGSCSSTVGFAFRLYCNTLPTVTTRTINLSVLVMRHAQLRHTVSYLCMLCFHASGLIPQHSTACLAVWQ